jgi:hypothetical protein
VTIELNYAGRIFPKIGEAAQNILIGFVERLGLIWREAESNTFNGNTV